MTRIALQMVALLTVFLPSALFAKTWTDSSGTYTIEAELEKLDGNVVHLKKPDSNIIKVPLDKLSKADQAFARQQLAAKPDGATPKVDSEATGTLQTPSTQHAPEKPTTDAAVDKAKQEQLLAAKRKKVEQLQVEQERLQNVARSGRMTVQQRRANSARLEQLQNQITNLQQEIDSLNSNLASPPSPSSPESVEENQDSDSDTEASDKPIDVDRALELARTSRQELRRIDAKLTAQAVNSQMGNQLAALMRMGEEGMLQEGSKAWQSYQDLKAGKYKYQSQADFIQIMKTGGVDSAVANTILNQRETNIQGYGKQIVGNARNQQWDAEIANHMRACIANALGVIRVRQDKPDQGTDMVLGRIITATVRSTAGRTPAEVRAAIAAKLRKAGVSQTEANQLASVGYGAACETMPQLGYENITKAAILHNRKVLDQIVGDNPER